VDRLESRALSRIFLTGADGFVGKALADYLQRAGDSVVAAARRTETIAGVKVIRVTDIRTAQWQPAVEGVNAVIHLAARAHILRERSRDPLAEFRAVNVAPTIALFRACQAAAVERFIFVSSIGVNGTCTAGRAFTESDAARPIEPYAISKWEAEESLRALQSNNSTQLIVVRPALIYGPYAKGNFLRLMRWVDAGWPLPFGGISARRTFLGLTPLCELLKKCASIPLEGEQLFVAGDDEPVATRDLIRAIATAMHVKARQARLPPRLLSFLARTINRHAEFERLSNSLEVDSARAKSILGWTAPALGEDLQQMVDVYLRSKHGVR
jgi:nucleoside-diphosphate-sugar epimerase